MENAVVYPKFRIFVGIASAWAWLNIGWVIVGFAPLEHFIADEFQVPLGLVMIGVMAMNAIAGGVAVILCGPLVDKFGPRKMLFVSGILCTLYGLLIPFVCKTFTLTIIMRMVAGLVGHGPIFSGKAAMAQRWFPRKEQGTWIGIWNATFACGSAIMYQVYFPLLKHFEGEWRDVAAFVAVPSFILAILMGIALFGKEPPLQRHGGPAGAAQKDFSIALKLATFWAGGILLGCAQGIMQSVQALTAAYLMRGLQWRPFVAGPLLTSVQIGMVLSGFLLGAALIYIFRGKVKYMAAIGFLCAGMAAFGLTSTFAIGGPSHMRICLFVVGFFMNIGYPAVTTFVTANYPPHILGKVFGVCGGLSVFIGASLSAVAGILLDKSHTFQSAYNFILGIGIFATIVTLIFLNPVKVFAKKDAPAVPAAAAGETK
jgi:MFS family permease